MRRSTSCTAFQYLQAAVEDGEAAELHEVERQVGPMQVVADGGDERREDLAVNFRVGFARLGLSLVPEESFDAAPRSLNL